MEEGRENDKEIESLSKAWHEAEETIKIIAEKLGPVMESAWETARHAAECWIEMQETPVQKRRKLRRQYYKKKAEMPNNERRRRRMPMARRPKRQQWATYTYGRKTR